MAQFNGEEDWPREEAVELKKWSRSAFDQRLRASRLACGVEVHNLRATLERLQTNFVNIASICEAISFSPDRFKSSKAKCEQATREIET
jgi:hypothetical protein